jgi:dTDP-4-dehydrorhamnose reductase
MATGKKILLIGANGFLGNKLFEILSKEFEVVGTYHCRPKGKLMQLDIVNESQVKEFIETINPEIVIVTTAQTNVDLCETDKKSAEELHVKGMENVAKYCTNRKLVYYSTDSVFDGEKGNYVETDLPNPLNFYSKTKLMGEKIVEKVPDHLILRTCMLYSDQVESPKYINWVIKNLWEKKRVNAITDLFATPTLIDDLAMATLELIKRDQKGTYHTAGASALNCHEMALKIAEIFGFDKSLINPIREIDLKRAAKRPKNGVLNISKLEKEGIIMSTFEQGVRKVKESLKRSGFFDHYKVLTECRICKGTNLVPYLDLGKIPLVNSYVRKEDVEKADPRFPLQIMFCNNCALSQLSVVVDPKVMYTDYFYRSSISRTFREHCFELAKDSVNKHKFSKNDLIIDIASNDGCALKEFKKFDVRVLGVDPAKNLAEIAIKDGIPTIAEFWNEETAKKILEQYGEASMITAMNVFAHVDNVDSFLNGVNILLKGSGIFMVEFPYLLNFVNKNEFDTSYHEHLSYFLVKPLIQLFKRHGMEIFDIKKFTIHGGSIRVFVKKETNQATKSDTDSIKWLLELEKDLGLYDIKTYLKFSNDVEKIKSDLVDLLKKLKAQGKTIAAYGASAKGNVLSNYCGVGADLISYVVDDTPEKQGHYTPGNHIPIVDSSHLKTEKPDYLLLFAWNFAEELMAKTKDYKNAGGRYIIPIPNVTIV